MSHHKNDHDSHQDDGNELSFAEKGGKLLQHWLHHNEEHSQSYRRWATEFRNHQFGDVAALLENAVDLTEQINHTLSEAAALLNSQIDCHHC
jgi:hypothetical protein